MPRPDASRHRPEPAYLRQLIDRAGLTQAAAARALGKSPRQLRGYLSGTTPIPYVVQFAAESLAEKETTP